MNPNLEKTISQNNPETGANNNTANAFEKSGVTPASSPKEITLEAANDPKKAFHPRGGRGSKASSELTQLIKKTLEENEVADRQLETELRKDEKLLDKEVERMEDVYSQFSEDLDTLKKRLSEETDGKKKSRLHKLMSQANDHLRVLRKVIPKEGELGSQSEYDIEVFRSVAEKFKKYEEARRRQTIAEIDLNKKGGSIGKHEEARNEAVKLREEISSLIKQGESVIAQNNPHPAQDESIENIRTEGSELMRAVQPEADPEDVMILAPEGSVAGTLELPKEEQVGEVEQGVNVDDARINTPVEDLAEQVGASERLLRVEARMKEVSARQKEIAGKSGIASIEEKVELEKEAVSLMREKEKFAESAVSRETGLADEAIGHGMQDSDTARAIIAERHRIEAGSEKSTQGTADDWQGEAISKWEATSGKKVPDLELEHTPEEHNASLPILTEVVNEGDGVPVLTEVIDEAIGAPQEGEVSTLELKREETPEERKERILNIIYKKAEDVPERGKRAGMSEKMLDFMRAGGETYQALPLKTKLLVSVTLFGIAWTAGGTIASVAIGGSLFQRALGGLATFIGVEGSLKASAEKGGRERGKWEKNRHTAEALVAGFIVGGGALGHAIQNIFQEVVPSHSIVKATPAELSELEQGQANLAALDHVTVDATNVPAELSELEQGQANLAATEHLNATNVPVEGGAAAEAVNLNQFIKVAEAGDSRWSLVERVLEEGPYKDQFNAIASDEQRTYIIDALKDKLTAGMTAEQANALNVGDKIDFQEIFVDGDFMDKTFSDAHNLNPEELANVHNYSGEVASALENTPGIETPARMVSAEDFLNQPLHTDFAPPVDHALPPALASATHTEIPAPIHTMPQEIMPNDPQVLAYADQQVHTHVTTLFGSKGFLGFGAVDGMKSANWLDFANRPVSEIMDAKPNVFPNDGTVRVGIENNEALSKMKDYLKIAFTETRVQPEPGETIEKYLKRAAGMAIGKFMNKG